LKANHFVIAATVIAVAFLAVLFNRSQAVASSCTFPNGYAGVKPINAAMPDIPKSDNRSGLSAAALVMVGADGRPTSAKIVKTSGDAAVDRATVAAAMGSTYSPEMKACKPVTGMYLFKVETGGQ
jgi:TonB family protein